MHQVCSRITLHVITLDVRNLADPAVSMAVNTNIVRVNWERVAEAPVREVFNFQPNPDKQKKIDG